MARWIKVACGLAVLAGVGAVALPADAPLTDLPPISRLRAGANPPNAPTGEVPVFPEVLQVTVPQAAPPAGPRAEKLQPRSRIELIRFVQGEFARAVSLLPAHKKGYRHTVGQELNQEALNRTVGMGGSAARPGDSVQITKLEFRDKEIWVDINGGASPRKRWRDRISISGGMGGPRTSTKTTDLSGGPPGLQAVGSTLILDYGRPLPDITPDELKETLAPFLDFSRQRSAAVHWIDTLPKEFQEAIKERRAVVGMDREMVVAALGRPERKIRERDLDGLETEDWIYGHPPAETVFVKFAGEKVIAVREFPR
jgi:sulfur carrier protein ThiS